ncbi:hypothetical protein BV25DRAFT_437393 [Artomyces pyxidatus]|uniref:Uncharacterized protein n=1 Tax=Artomyces pyxidatus TaxID=48021 RepID=A0ACB8T491_9AGAM|nr:hypothetical protein BV25DRAFT_437393 [Artomyces pyxidatus]
MYCLACCRKHDNVVGFNRALHALCSHPTWLLNAHSTNHPSNREESEFCADLVKDALSDLGPFIATWTGCPRLSTRVAVYTCWTVGSLCESSIRAASSTFVVNQPRPSSRRLPLEADHGTVLQLRHVMHFPDGSELYDFTALLAYCLVCQDGFPFSSTSSETSDASLRARLVRHSWAARHSAVRVTYQRRGCHMVVGSRTIGT